MARLSSRTRLLLLALILIAWAWRLYGIEAQSLWRDEVDSLRFATRPLAQVLGNFTRPGENGPLYFLLLRPWLALAGQSEFALRFPSVLFGVLALPLIFALGRRLMGVGIALVGVMLLAVNPYHVWYSQEAKMYALLVALQLLILWVFVRALDRGKWWRWLLWVALTSVSLYIHVLAVLLVPVELAWWLLVPRWRGRWRPLVASIALLVLPYLPVVWWQWALLTTPTFRTGHAFVKLDAMLLTLVSAQYFGIPAVPSAWVFAPAIFALLAGIVLLRARLLLLSWWLIPALLLFAITLVTPLFTDRYLIWTLPAYVLLLAGGVRMIGKEQRWLGAALLAALLIIQLWAGWLQATTPFKTDLRAAAAYVKAARNSEDLTLFLIPYIRYTYQYYDPGPYDWADAPYANREPDASEIPTRLADLTAGHRGVWLVESESDFYDRQGLIRAWLEAHGSQRSQMDFARARVSYYALD